MRGALRPALALLVVFTVLPWVPLSEVESPISPCATCAEVESPSDGLESDSVWGVSGAPREFVAAKPTGASAAGPSVFERAFTLAKAPRAPPAS